MSYAVILYLRSVFVHPHIHLDIFSLEDRTKDLFTVKPQWMLITIKAKQLKKLYCAAGLFRIKEILDWPEQLVQLQFYKITIWDQ